MIRLAFNKPLRLTITRLFIFALIILFSAAAHAQKTPVQLAQVYNNEDIQAYLISEKYDGIRAIWKNQELRTRNGNIINAPQWFTQNLPNIWLDGELWLARGEFELTASTVSKHSPIDTEWRRITYMVFDAPNYHLGFAERAEFYTALVNKLDLPHIRAVAQLSLSSNQNLHALLEQATSKGAEGLMLHKASARFSNGRNSNLLKLKKYMDSEAIVLKHLPGKGKYKNKMGALLVEYIDPYGQSIQFKIGTGFSDHQRAHPPAIGTVITFAYHGFTKKGLPRFASFIRQHQE